MDRRDDLVDLILEDAQRRRIGDHERRHVGSQRRTQGLEVDAAALVGSDRHRLVADHGCGRGVRAMRRVGHEHLRSRIPLTARPMVGTGHQHAGQLAVRAGRGLQRHGRHPADLLQLLGQQPHQLQRSLRQRLRIERVRLGQAREPR